MTAFRAEDGPRFGKPGDAPYFLGRRAAVHGHEHGPGHHPGETGDSPFGPVLRVEQDPVARMQATGPPLPADVAGQGENVLEGTADPAIVPLHLQRGLVPVHVRALGQYVRQRIEMGQGVLSGLGEPGPLRHLLFFRDRGLRLIGLQHVAFQAGDMDFLEIRLPVDPGDVAVEEQPVLRIQTFVQLYRPIRLESTFQGRVGTVDRGVVQHARDRRLHHGDSALQVVQQGDPVEAVERPQCGVQGIDVAQVVPAPELAKRRVGPTLDRYGFVVPVQAGMFLKVLVGVFEGLVEEDGIPVARRHVVHADPALPGRARHGRQGRIGHDVHRDDVHDHVLLAGEVRQATLAHRVDERVGHLESLDPSRFGLDQRAFHDGRPYDGRGQVPAVLDDQLLAHGLRQGIAVVPPPLLPAPHALFDEPFLEPALAKGLHLGVEPALRGARVLLQRHLPETILLARRPGFVVDLVRPGEYVPCFLFQVERRFASPHFLGHGPVRPGRDFGNASLGLAVDVGRRDVDQRGVAARSGEFQHAPRTEGVELKRGIDFFVEGHGSRAGEHDVDFRREPAVQIRFQPEVVQGKVALDSVDLRVHDIRETIAMGLAQPGEGGGLKDLFLHPFPRLQRGAVLPAAGPDDQVDASDFRGAPQNLLHDRFRKETGSAGDQQRLSLQVGDDFTHTIPSLDAVSRCTPGNRAFIPASGYSRAINCLN